jgi:hypothetical protein
MSIARITSLEKFVSQSKTFNGFTFQGHYGMHTEMFIKLYEHFKKTGENYLDVYSELQWLIWDMNSSKANDECQIDYDEHSKLRQYISIARRLHLYDFDTLKDIIKYIDKLRNNYMNYLEHLRNEPRRDACKFTALKEVQDYVYSKYGRKCIKCGATERISLDHVIPIVKGGEDKVENLQPLCKSCNSSKGIKIIDYRYGKAIHRHK